MEIDPYKILDLPKKYSIDQLRSQFKKIALSCHPDKGGNEYMFKVVTKCYKVLLEEYNRREGDKQFMELKAAFTKNQDQQQYQNIQLSPQEAVGRFNINKFNSIFEQNKPSSATDIGYQEWMRQNDLRDAPTLQKNISNERFNEQFDKYSDTIKDKSNRQLIKFKEPEPMLMSKKLNFIELGQEKIDDYSGENRTNRDLNYMDYRVAHSTTKLVDPKNVKQRKDFRSVEEYESERAAMKKLSNKELVHIEKRRIAEEEKERKRQEYQKMLDDINYEQFRKMNKLMLGI